MATQIWAITTQIWPGVDSGIAGCDGSLWIWEGTAGDGEHFEPIGVNLDTFDENGLMTNSIVDWPYPADYVRQAFATGNTG